MTQPQATRQHDSLILSRWHLSRISPKYIRLQG